MVNAGKQNLDGTSMIDHIIYGGRFLQTHIALKFSAMLRRTRQLLRSTAIPITDVGWTVIFGSFSYKMHSFLNRIINSNCKLWTFFELWPQFWATWLKMKKVCYYAMMQPSVQYRSMNSEMRFPKKRDNYTIFLTLSLLVSFLGHMTGNRQKIVLQSCCRLPSIIVRHFRFTDLILKAL